MKALYEIRIGVYTKEDCNYTRNIDSKKVIAKNGEDAIQVLKKKYPLENNEKYSEFVEEVVFVSRIDVE